LIRLWHDRLVAARADMPLAPTRIVKAQFPAFKLAWLTMEEVNERDAARRDRFLRVVAMRAEKVAVIADRDLSLHVRDRKLFDPELLQHPRQHPSDALQDDLLMLSQVHEHPRAPMVIIDHSRISAGRNYDAVLKLRFVLQRVVKQFVEFLWSQEFVQDDALRPHNCRSVHNANAAVRV